MEHARGLETSPHAAIIWKWRGPAPFSTAGVSAEALVLGGFELDLEPHAADPAPEIRA